MATFGEMIYMVLDLLKERSDDAYYTEEHVMFLLSKMRALLIERKYKGSRNSSFMPMSSENEQQICLMIEPAQLPVGMCDGSWVQSTSAIPDIIEVGSQVTCTGHDLALSNVTFIPAERMKYVGYNKWLKNIIYAAKSKNGHLYLRSFNPQVLFLQRLGLTAIFADPVAAAKMSHEACETGKCDIMNVSFPLESSLIPQCVEMVVQELAGSRYTPEDKNNNAKDDLGSVGVAQQRVARPAENSTYRRRAEAEDE